MTPDEKNYYCARVRQEQWLKLHPAQFWQEREAAEESANNDRIIRYNQRAHIHNRDNLSAPRAPVISFESHLLRKQGLLKAVAQVVSLSDRRQSRQSAS